MATISHITLPDNTDYSIQATGIFFGQVDSTSTNTVYTATIPGITEYYDGLTILLKNGIVTSASGFTININDLGAKPSYSNMATGNDITPTAPTRDTTIFNINYTMLFVYDSTLVEDGAWICYRGYDANTNTIGYQLRTNSYTLKTYDKFRYYRILFTSADDTHWVPANTGTDNSATSTKTVNQRPINPFGSIVYCGNSTSYAAEANVAASAIWQQYTLTLGYSFNRTGAALTLTTQRPVFIKCAPQSNGSAIIDSTTPYVQALPSTDDGKIYIFLGIAYSATMIEMTLNHPVYYYKDGAIRLWTNAPTVSVPTASDANPQMDGTAAAGTSNNYSRADHVHPSDTSRMAANLKGVANGVAELDANGRVPSSQLPSYVDDVIEGYYYNSKFYEESSHTTEISGETGKIYVDLSTEKTYRWSGTAFVEISASLALGETSSTAYRGDRGKTAYDHSQLTSGNPHNVSKSDIGLGNVDNVQQYSASNPPPYPVTSVNGSTGAVTLTIPSKTSDLTNDSGFITGMYIGSYGSSTYAEILAAYQANKVVYCRASSNSNPGTGSQNRMAFLAYVNNSTTPTEFEFQYYRSVSTHSDSQQGDQVFVYKLNSSTGWSVTTREAYTKITTGTGLSKSYSNGILTLTNSGVHSATINGDYLRVNTNGTNEDLTIPYATKAAQDNEGNVIDTTYLKISDSISDISYDVTTGSIQSTIGETTTNIVQDVSGYDPDSETITTLVDNVTVSGFYLDDDSEGNYATNLYRSANNALTGFSTSEFVLGNKYLVIWDGVEYICNAQLRSSSCAVNSRFTSINNIWDCRVLGNATLLNFAPTEKANLPFVITYRYDRDTNVIIWTNSTSASHIITIKQISRNYKELVYEELPYFLKDNGTPIINKGTGSSSIILGGGSDASGAVSLAVGGGTRATGYASIAAGGRTLAQGSYSIALGFGSITHAQQCIAGGSACETLAGLSFALGQLAKTSGLISFSFGDRTEATGRASMVIGQYNIPDDDDGTNYTQYGNGAKKYVFIIGNGTANGARSNALTVDWDGNEAIAGSLTLGLGTANEITLTPAQLATVLASLLPAVSASDNGKVLTVVNGAWAAADLPTYQGGVS